jgi:hypothetical protein
MLSILTLLMVLTFSILVTRIASVALTHTGLSRESAKFQARSAFTGVGFTTSESEKVVNHPVRRRILLLLMLLGNAGIVTAVSTLIISFVNFEGTIALFWRIALLITGIVALWSVAASRWVDQRLSKLINRMLKRYTSLNVKDFAGLLHLAGEYQVTEMQVREADWLAGRNLKEADLRREGVLVLGINKPDGRFAGAPEADTQIEAHDTLILYGRVDSLQNLDKRKRGFRGDIEHTRKVAEQREVAREEKKQLEAEETEGSDKS